MGNIWKRFAAGLALALAGWGLSWAQAPSSAPASASAAPISQAIPSMPAAEVPNLAPIAPLGRDDTPLLAGHALAWVDDSGTLGIDDVVGRDASLPWHRLDAARRYGIDDKVLWVRFDATLPVGSQWRLVLQHPGVDVVRMYWRDARGRWTVQSAGETVSVDEWPLPGRVPALALADGTGTPQRYWLRIERERVDFSVPMLLYEERHLLQLRDREQLVLGFYFGVVLFLLAGSIVGAVLYGERSLRAFAVYIAGVGMWQFVNLGLGAQHLWSHWPHWTEVARSVAPGVGAASAMWFIKVLTEPARFSRALDLGCAALIAAITAAVALNAFIATRGSNALVLMLVGLEIPLATVLLALAWRKVNDRYVRTVVLGFVPLVLVAAVPVAHGLSLIPSSLLTRYGLIFGTAVQLPAAYYALSRRAVRRRETGVRAAELSHTDALTGLWDRNTLAQRIDDAVQRAVGLRHQCALLGVRLTNLQTLEDELGREIADRALIVAASVLRGAARDIDAPARTGEFDFCLLLDGPTSAQAALGKAQEIVARGLQQAQALPPTTTLKFHVAVLILPDHELDAARCLKWLDEALSAMRADPKRAIRSLNF